MDTSISYFFCGASVLFHWFQSLSIVGHKFSTLIQSYFMHYSSNCLIFCGFCLWTLTFKVFHKFSIGFKSGDWLCKFRVQIPLFWNHSFVSFVACSGTLSCWSTKFWPCPKEVADFWRFFSRISLYILPFILPWITCNSRVPIDEKHSHIIIEPPPDLTVGMVLCFLKAVSFFRQTLAAVFLRIVQLLFHPTKLPFPKTAYLSFHKFRQTLIGRRGLFAHFIWSTLKYTHLFFSAFHFLEGLLYRRHTSSLLIIFPTVFSAWFRSLLIY